MSELSLEDQIEIARVQNDFLDEIGCECPGTRVDIGQIRGSGDGAYAVSGPHSDDCPGVAYFSDPANHPDGCDCGQH